MSIEWQKTENIRVFNKTNKSKSRHKNFEKNYINFRQMKMKLYTTINESYVLMVLLIYS